MQELLVNRLSSLPWEKCGQIKTRPTMTIAVDLERKATKQKMAIFKALYGSHSQSKNGLYISNFVYLSSYLPNFHEMFPKFEGKSSFLKLPNKKTLLFTVCLQKVLSKFEQ